MPPPLKLGLTFLHTGERAQDIARLVARSEEAGFDFAGFADSQSIFRDTYCAMAVAAVNTDRIQIGPTVTNPITRHPVVTASAIATIDEISGFRAFLGIGSGNSAIYNLRGKPARIKDLRSGVQLIQTAFDSASESVGRIESEGRKSVLLSWPKRQPPIYLAAAGPKAMEVAAECANGVILDIGADLALVRTRIAAIRAHLDRFARSDKFEVWLYTKGLVSTSDTEVRNVLGSIVAAAGNDSFRVSLSDKDVPPELVEPLREFHRRYSFEKHGDARSSTNIELMEELGLAEFLFGRFAITGSTEDVVARLREFQGAGVTGVLFSGAVPDKENLIDRFSDVIVRLRSMAS